MYNNVTLSTEADLLNYSRIFPYKYSSETSDTNTSYNEQESEEDDTSSDEQESEEDNTSSDEQESGKDDQISEEEWQDLRAGIFQIGAILFDCQEAIDSYYKLLTKVESRKSSFDRFQMNYVLLTERISWLMSPSMTIDIGFRFDPDELNFYDFIEPDELIEKDYLLDFYIAEIDFIFRPIFDTITPNSVLEQNKKFNLSEGYLSRIKWLEHEESADIPTRKISLKYKKLLKLYNIFQRNVRNSRNSTFQNTRENAVRIFLRKQNVIYENDTRPVYEILKRINKKELYKVKKFIQRLDTDSIFIKFIRQRNKLILDKMGEKHYNFFYKSKVGLPKRIQRFSRNLVEKYFYIWNVEENLNKFFENLIQIQKVLKSNSKNNLEQNNIKNPILNKNFTKDKDFSKGIEKRVKTLNKYPVILIANKRNLPKQEFIFIEPYELQTNYPEGIRTLIKELKLELLGPEYDFEDIGLTDLYKEIFHYTFSLTIEPRVVQDDELVYQYEENLKRSDFFPIQNTLHKLKNYINKNLLGKTLKYDPMFPFKLQNGFLEKSQLANMIDSYYKNPNYSSSIRPICLIFNAGDEEKIKVEEYYRELVNKIKYDMDILRIHGKANELKKLENINLIKVGLGDLIFQLSANRSSTNIVCSSPFKNKQKLPLPLKQNVIQRAEIFRRKVYKEQYGDKRLSFVPIIPEFKKEFFK